MKAKCARYLDAKGIRNSSQKLNVRTVQLAGSFPNPQHVSRTVIVKPRSRILPSKCLFIRQKQAFMRCPKLCCSHDWVVNCESSSGHKSKDFIYPVSQFTVPIEPDQLYDYA